MKQERKKELRQRIRLLGQNHDYMWRKKASQQIWAQIERLMPFQQAHTVALYWSLKDEVETPPFIRRWCDSKRILLPEVRGENLVFRKYDPREGVSPGAFGIGEAHGEECPPEEVDLIIVPGVAFDRQGGRMGRGKGFYDRFLVRCPAYKIGICFHYQLADEIPCEEHDIRMDTVISNPAPPKS